MFVDSIPVASSYLRSEVSRRKFQWFFFFSVKFLSLGRPNFYRGYETTTYSQIRTILRNQKLGQRNQCFSFFDEYFPNVFFFFTNFSTTKKIVRDIVREIFTKGWNVPWKTCTNVEIFRFFRRRIETRISNGYGLYTRSPQSPDFLFPRI